MFPHTPPQFDTMSKKAAAHSAFREGDAEGDQVARLTDAQVQANSRKIELFLWSRYES